MKVDIFSDIRCPFCYVGKKKFEKGLEQFANAKDIEVVWHSFQLDPHLKTQPDRDPYDFFSEAKVIPLQQAKMMHQHAFNAGKEAGIDFNFDNQKVANSYKGHLLIQLAKQKGLANEMEEELFKAQFITSKNIDDNNDLIEIGKNVGLTEDEVKNALNSDELKNKITEDEYLSRQIGVRAVPFFVFNDKYAVSGAQNPEVFLEVLEKSYEEFSAGDKGLQLIEGDSCDVDGNCD